MRIYKAKNVPLDDDIAVFARIIVRLNNDPRNRNLHQLAVLAQRVIIEKSKRCYQRKNSKRSMASIYHAIEEISKNQFTAQEWADKLTGDSLIGRVWKSYLDSGLLDD